MKSLMQEMVELLKKVESVEVAAEKLIEKAYDKGFEAGVNYTDVPVAKPIETDQQKRDRLVEQAKEFVEGVIYDLYDGDRYDYYNVLRSAGPVSTKFHVNDKNKVVTALLFHKHLKDTPPRFKGFAKCAPNDCFNEHIGKAIALHRALGLDVPQEYLDVPNPTKLRVGNVVRTNEPDFYDTTPYEVVKLVGGKAYDDEGWIPTDYLDIIDDSESEPNV